MTRFLQPKYRPHYLLLMAALLLASCSKKTELHHGSAFTFGTIVDFSIAHADPAAIQRATKTLQDDLDFMHFSFHSWQPGPINRTNLLLEMAANFTANPTVLPLIEQSQRLSQQSQGLFNPAIGRLIKAWGFQSDMGPEDEMPPEPEHIQALLAVNPQMSDIVVDNVRMRSTNPAVRLDMGAIAKGYALDQIIEHLQDQGIAHVIINAGGDLKAIGQHPQGRPWSVGIRHPRQQDAVLAGLEVMSGESVFTSGDYERFFMYDDKRYHHIIDPRSGYPADKTQSVTVIAASATLADAASTALFIAGPELWPTIARAMHIEHVLFVDADGNAEATPAMLKRLQQLHPALKVQPRSLP